MPISSRRRTTRGRSLWQHGSSFGRGAESDQRRSFPASIEVLLDGQVLPAYGDDGAANRQSVHEESGMDFAGLFRRSGWQEEEIDLASFADVAAYCAETIATTDLNGTTISFQDSSAILSCGAAEARPM